MAAKVGESPVKKTLAAVILLGSVPFAPKTNSDNSSGLSAPFPLISNLSIC